MTTCKLIFHSKGKALFYYRLNTLDAENYDNIQILSYFLGLHVFFKVQRLSDADQCLKYCILC